MPDPQVLYVVTAVVVLALIAWVVAVLTGTGDAVDASKVEALPAGAGAGPSGPPPSESNASKTIPALPPVDIADKKSARPESTETASAASAASAEVQVDVEEEEEPTGPHALILISAVGRTDPGLKRKHNEDAYSILEDHHLFVIADGMGRHAAGEVASKLAVDAIGDSFEKGTRPSWTPEGTLPKRASQLRDAIILANEKIFHEAHDVEEYAGMGTTVVACYFSPNNQRVYIAHVGDSRCYRYRGNTMSQLTKDHTLGAAGIQGRSSSVLSRAVGVEERVEVDLNMESPLPGDIYLLCSDGLSRMLTDPEISETLGAMKDLDACVAKLIDMANARGGRDNITTILVRVEDAPRTSSSPPRTTT
jgi:serine/threonine protein phosphatase PrpC